MGVARPLILLGFLALSLAACGEPRRDGGGDCDPVALAAAGAWQLADAADDPFADHRPTDPACPAWALTTEGESLEVDTGECGYATLVQPLPVALRAGDTLTATIAWFDLVAEAPAEAHVALALGGATLWEATVPIPSATRVEAIAVALPADAPAGTPLAFHVHNHGANSWFITAVEGTRACAVAGGPYE